MAVHIEPSYTRVHIKEAQSAAVSAWESDSLVDLTGMLYQIAAPFAYGCSEGINYVVVSDDWRGVVLRPIYWTAQPPNASPLVVQDEVTRAKILSMISMYRNIARGQSAKMAHLYLRLVS